MHPFDSRYGLLSCCAGTYDPVLPRRRFLMLPGRTDRSQIEKIVDEFKCFYELMVCTLLVLDS